MDDDGTPTRPALSARLAEVRAEIDTAARRGGRQPEDVTLVVVTKSVPPTVFPALGELGATDLGENRIQGVAERLAGYEAAFRWHFIGHLQSNKARKAVPLFDVFHGVDSVDLMLRLDRLAGEFGRRPELFLQVNVSGEDSKSGLPPEAVSEAVERSLSLEHARLVGLMTMAPRVEDREQTRPVFRALAALREAHGPAAGHPGLTQLSMGMTRDFAIAVEEGATCVRVGRRIVGPVDGSA